MDSRVCHAMKNPPHRKKSSERRAGLGQVQSFQFKLILYLGCVQKNAKRSVRLTQGGRVVYI